MSYVRTIEHSNHRIEISIDRSRSIDRFRSIDRSIDRFRNRSRPDRPRVDATRHKKNRSTIAMMRRRARARVSMRRLFRVYSSYSTSLAAGARLAAPRGSSAMAGEVRDGSRSSDANARVARVDDARRASASAMRTRTRANAAALIQLSNSRRDD